VTAASRTKAGALGDLKQDPDAQGKRKREALVEVSGLMSNSNKVKDDTTTKGVKGKGKEESDVKVLKAKTATITTAAETCQPLRTVLGLTTRRTTRQTVVAPAPTPALAPAPKLASKPVLKVKNEPRMEVHLDELMVVDPTPPDARRISAPKVAAAQTSNTAAIAHHSEIYRQSSKIFAQQQQIAKEEIEEGEHIFKKARTSSEEPEVVPKAEERLPLSATELELEAYADEEPEADPEGDQWDDLDAEGADDPLMVSEYVSEICQYMRELEVSVSPGGWNTSD
jgi:G2/mitotic-specific cyclin 1/2